MLCPSAASNALHKSDVVLAKLQERHLLHQHTFRFKRLSNRYFVDGGMEYNNPSEFIFEHYTEFDLASASRGRAGNVEEAERGARHAHLDLSRVRFINLGTGDKPKDKPPRKRDVLAETSCARNYSHGSFLEADPY